MTIQRVLLLFEPRKENILRSIKAVNEKFGWVSPEAIGKIARYFNVSESHIFSVASFYDEINIKKPSQIVIEVCDSANCQVKNAEKIIEDLKKILKIKEDDPQKRFELKRMSCAGRCLEGPVVKINGKIHTKMDAKKIAEIIQYKMEKR